ncbi:LTA synthase family protein [Pinirhizobacter sp.]|uniref:LTA synthase family protein n=1 Tax=Pinirhizobacter sp. TaxID=2950432 RepID=UPI002F416F0A
MLSLCWRFFLAAVLLTTVCRLVFATWQGTRVRAAGGLWPVMRGGLRIDLSFFSMVAGFPFLLAPWLGGMPWAVWIVGAWFSVWWCIVVLLEVCTPQFIIEYDTRPNRLFIEYLGNPREVSTMLWRGFKAMLLGGLVVTVLLCMAGLAFIHGGGPDPALALWQKVVLTLVLFVVLFALGRGSLGHRPLNAAQVAFCSDAMINQLPLNSAFVVANAIMVMRSDKPASAVYGRMPADEVQAVVAKAWGRADGDTQHRQVPSVKRGNKPNLVIIIEESLGAQFVGCLGGRGLTPRLDALAGEGWLLARTYATGTRSVRGLEAVMTGFPPTPAEAVVKLPRSQRDFFTIAGLLKHFGYASRFIYGGEAHFDNMKGFCLGNGFDDVVDLPKFAVKPGFTGSWGASDEDMFNELHHRLMHDGDQPTLSVAFSVSNHTPWEYPAGRLPVDGDPATVDNTVRYADWALGEFFDRAKQSPYWANTVFLVVADHDARVHGASLVPVRHFHIPALIVGSGVAPRRDERMVSQMDLPPTLLSLMGIDCMHPMPGFDLSRHDPDRAVMQYSDNQGYLKGTDLLVMQPDSAPVQFAYDRATETMTPAEVDPLLAREALAQALWASASYMGQRYRVSTDQPQG